MSASQKTVTMVDAPQQSSSMLEPILQQAENTINYGIHMHPMTQLKAPDLLDRDKNSMFDIICSILYTSLPLILSLQLNYFTTFVNIFIIGNHGSQNELAGIGLASFIVNIFGFMVIENISVGFSVICSYFKSKVQVGYLYQKTLGINFFICILITPILYLGERAILAIGFNEEMTKMSGVYMWALVPSFYLYAFYDTTRNYLYSQQVIYPSLIISSTFGFLHCIIAYSFVFYWDLGLTGAAWAKNITQGLSCLTLYLYITFKEPTKQSWIQWDIKSTNNVHRFLMAIFSHQVFLYFEIIAFQLLGLIACYLSKPWQVDAHIILSVTLFVFYLTFQGFCFCVSKALSQSIELNDIKGAKKKLSLAMLVMGALVTLMVLNVFSRRAEFVNLFINDQLVAAQLNQNLFVFVILVAIEGFHNLFLNTIKTLQVRKYWKITICSSYIIGLGSAMFLSFKLEWGLAGIWWGWLIAISICLLLELKFIISIDWQEHFQVVREKYKIITHETRMTRKSMASQHDQLA